MVKSEFCQKSVKYCGYVVEDGKLKIDKGKIKLLLKWPVPENASAVRSFLGFLGYYRRFIKDFGTLAAPLHDISGTKSEWRWTTVEQNSFEKMKDAMMSEPVQEMTLCTTFGPMLRRGLLVECWPRIKEMVNNLSHMSTTSSRTPKRTTHTTRKRFWRCFIAYANGDIILREESLSFTLTIQLL